MVRRRAQKLLFTVHVRCRHTGQPLTADIFISIPLAAGRSNPVKVAADLRRGARRALDRPLIDATFGSTIEANLLESFTGQGLFKGEEAAPASGKIEPSADSEGTN